MYTFWFKKTAQAFQQFLMDIVYKSLDFVFECLDNIPVASQYVKLH